jgi:hypothetical protein
VAAGKLVRLFAPSARFNGPGLHRQGGAGKIMERGVDLTSRLQSFETEVPSSIRVPLTRIKIEKWRIEYNRERPYSGLGKPDP